MILTLSIASLLLIFSLGGHIGWAIFQYDELRLSQLFLGIISFIILIFKKKLEIDKFTLLFIILNIIFIIYRINGFNIFELQELIILIIIPLLIWACSESLKLFLFHDIIFLLIITTTIPCLFIFLSIKNFIDVGIWYDWQLNAGSIRIYDSVVVPLIFLTIYLKITGYKYIQKIYPFIICLLTLGLWFDSARAALFSVVFGLIILLIFYKNNRKIVLITIILILLSFFIYYLTYYFYNRIYIIDDNLNIIRTNSSGRYELWVYVYSKWLEQPWLGVGGNYLATTEYPLNHIHNYYLKLIFEWGFTGFIYLIWIFYQIKKVLSSNNVHISLKAGIIAIAIDAFFSGNLVYPASQLSITLLLSLVFYQYKSNSKIIGNTKILTRTIIILWFGFYTYLLGNYFLQDLLCWQCGSYSDLIAPGFWYYGKAKHLIHHSLIP